MAALSSLGYRPLAPVDAGDFADREKRAAWIRDKGLIVFQLYSDAHREMRIDLFVEEPFDFDREYDGAMSYALSPQLAARYVQLDTLIEMKRKVGRPKDLVDLTYLTRLHRA
jgi:hypothetical protein